jgi:hypothetical protein
VRGLVTLFIESPSYNWLTIPLNIFYVEVVICEPDEVNMWNSLNEQVKTYPNVHSINCEGGGDKQTQYSLRVSNVLLFIS